MIIARRISSQNLLRPLASVIDVDETFMQDGLDTQSDRRVLITLRIALIAIEAFVIDKGEKVNKNLTEIVYIMDRSGSMHHLALDVIGGFNAFVEEQKKVEGDAVITTILFNSETETVHNHTNLSNVIPMKIEDFHARGMTALMDAVGSAIDSVGKRLSETPEDDRPSKVLFVIMTDGMENASCRYDVARVKEMIEHQQEKYGWEFIFVGAGINAYAVGNTIGVKKEHTMNTNASADGMSAMYCAMSAATTSLRSKGFVSPDWKEGHEPGC